MKNMAATASAIVRETKALLDEAQAWWPWSWASQANQDRIRSAIERATAALDREIARARKRRRSSRALEQAEFEFSRATELAKKTFDEAEKEWSPAKAREGALLAKAAIEKHERVLQIIQP